jgi:hypothetical protein
VFGKPWILLTFEILVIIFFLFGILASISSVLAVFDSSLPGVAFDTEFEILFFLIKPLLRG